MKIEQKQISIRELTKGYEDKGETGVFGFSGELSIRPAYQREFIYKNEQRDKVIETVRRGFPLNIMYWAKNPDSALLLDESLRKFEVLDGQQRTVSICMYVNGEFSIDQGGNPLYFHSLTQDQKDAILDYELTVYVCEGPESEKLEWFKTINIAGEKLTDQELLNAVYTGKWLTSAKDYFSKTNCVADNISSDYVSGSPIRQELLETALNWISDDKPAQYMAAHQSDATAIALWNYFSNVINWVKASFPVARKEMKSVNWGKLYNHYKDTNLDPKALETRIQDLMLDEDVSRKAGIYTYLLSGEQRHLSLRSFTDKVKREVYTKQDGMCASHECPKKGHRFKLDEMEGDHIDPWHEGGKTTSENCQMLCKPCNRRKGGT